VSADISSVPLGVPFRLNFSLAPALWESGVAGATEYDLYHAHQRGVRRWIFDGERLTPVEPSAEDLAEWREEQRAQREREDAEDRAMGLPPDNHYSWRSMRARDAAAALPQEKL
jgi:hypothetical protein